MFCYIGDIEEFGVLFCGYVVIGLVEVAHGKVFFNLDESK